MKLYRTRTQEEYDWLMQELEKVNYQWFSGDKPTADEVDYWVVEKDETFIEVDELNKEIERIEPNYGLKQEYTEVSELMEEKDPLTTKVEERNNKPTPKSPLTNSKADRHEQLLNYLNEIYRAKNKDYGDAFGKSHEKYGAIAGLTRINDKFNRLEELILSGEQLVEDETVLDTLLDLANYSIMLYMEVESEPNAKN